MKDNKISVIIPTIGRPSLFNLLINLLNQSKKPDEVLIIDNSVNKNAYQIYLRLKKEKILKYIYLKTPGQYNALNYGINKASYDNLCFIDDDCLPDKNWLKNLFNCYLRFNKKLVIIGKNKCFNDNNLFSAIEYYNDQSFFEKFFYKKKDKIFSFFLDIKNVFLNKKIIKENKLKFNNLKFLDIDFSFQLFKKNIKIFYCYKALNYHLGRTDLFSHIKREVIKGIDNYQLFLKWQSTYRKIFFYQKIYKNENDFQKKLLKKILFDKNYFFKISFYFFYYLDFLIRLIGFIFF